MKTSKKFFGMTGHFQGENVIKIRIIQSKTTAIFNTFWRYCSTTCPQYWGYGENATRVPEQLPMNCVSGVLTQYRSEICERRKRVVNEHPTH